MALKLMDIGERRSIEAIRNVYPYSWQDDDCYHFISGGEHMLITTDSMTPGQHLPKEADVEKMGYFFAATNLSDIAAMGGKPRYFMTALTMPRHTSIKYLKELERGMHKCLIRYGTRMVGGDLKEGSFEMTGITIGEARKGELLRRKGTHLGDLLCVTGELGKNAGAYELWKRHRTRKWANAMIDVEPRIREGRIIAKAGATAAMDLSDGVNAATYQLGKINNCGFEIDYSALPIHRLALEASTRFGNSIEYLALDFGGEYELAFTISRRNFVKVAARMERQGMHVTAIGRATKAGRMLIKNGKRIKISSRGYEHFLGM